MFVGLFGFFYWEFRWKQQGSGLQTSESLSSERSHFLVSFFFLIIIPPTLHAAEVLFFLNMTLSSATLSVSGE